MRDPESKPSLLDSFPFKLSRSFIFYACIGVSGVILDYIVYAVLINLLSWNYLTSNIISSSLGITHNFILNAFLNFKVRDDLFRRFFKFYGVGATGIGICLVLLWWQVEILNVPPLIAKFLTIICVVLLQYNLNRKLSFREKSDTGV